MTAEELAAYIKAVQGIEVTVTPAEHGRIQVTWPGWLVPGQIFRIVDALRSRGYDTYRAECEQQSIVAWPCRL